MTKRVSHVRRVKKKSIENPKQITKSAKSNFRNFLSNLKSKKKSKSVGSPSKVNSEDLLDIKCVTPEQDNKSNEIAKPTRGRPMKSIDVNVEESVKSQSASPNKIIVVKKRGRPKKISDDTPSDRSKAKSKDESLNNPVGL